MQQVRETWGALASISRCGVKRWQGVLYDTPAV